MTIKQTFTIIYLTIVVLLVPTFAQQETHVGLPDGAIARLGKGGINVMRFSPDGTRLAVGSDIGVWLYDVSTGKEIPLPDKVVGQVNAVAFSHNGSILACGGYFNPIIQLWDIESGNELPQLSVPVMESIIGYKRDDGLIKIRSVIELSFTEDDTKLIGVGHDGKFIHWDLNSYKIESEYQKYSISEIKASALSQDGRTFLMGNRIGEITLWDTHTGSREAIISGHKPKFKFSKKRTGIRAVAFSADGNIFASGSEDLTVQLWHTERRNKSATLKGHKEWITALALSEDGNTVASGDTDGVVRVWHTHKKRLRAILDEHKNSITALAFSPDGKTFASGSADGTIQFWDSNSWKKRGTTVKGHTEWVKAIAFSPDNTTVSTAMYNNTVQKYDVHTGEPLSDFTAAQQNMTRMVTLSPDATLLACYPAEGNTVFNTREDWHTDSIYQAHGKNELWDLTTGKKLPPMIQSSGEMIHSSGEITFSPDSKKMAWHSSEYSKKWRPGILFGTYTHVEYNGIYIWNVRSGDKLTHFKPDFLSGVKPFAFSPDGNMLLTSGSRSFFELRLWDVDKPQNPIILTEGADAVAFSPDGALLATIRSYDIYIWDAVTGKKLRELAIREGDGAGGKALAFSPDGSILLVSKFVHVLPFCLDTVELFDVNTSEKLLSLPGHTETIETLVFSHDGKILASGSRDGTVLLWDWDTILTDVRLNNRRPNNR